MSDAITDTRDGDAQQATAADATTSAAESTSGASGSTPTGSKQTGGDASGGWGMRRKRAKSSLFAAGEAMVWLTGGALAVCCFMVAGLLLLVLARGLGTFWPNDLVHVQTPDGRVYMGEITRAETYKPTENVIDGLEPQIQQQARATIEQSGGWLDRQLMRTGNFRLTQRHFQWIGDYEVAERTLPEWAMVMERLEWGRFYGTPQAFVRMSEVPEGTPDAIRSKAAELEGQLEQGMVVRLVDRRSVDGQTRNVFVPVAEAGALQDFQGVAEVAEGSEAAWQAFKRFHPKVRDRWHERRDLEEFDTGEVNYRQEKARLAVRDAEIALGNAESDSARATAQAQLDKAEAKFEEVRAWADQEFTRIRKEIDAINGENRRYQLVMETAGEGTAPAQITNQRLDDIVRAYPANRLGFFDKLGIYFSRWGEFLTNEPREANSEGGVFPAIFGTVAMTLIMSIAVVPFGVLAALYLREYAKRGPLVSAVRIAVNNLAGVPSIVFGVFGLGFFCYVMGASVDQLFFEANLPNPTYGKGGLLWASLTLALLTLPVVIVATEEAVSAVPNSMREGSYACGASKWQTIKRIVLPRALPGIITGMILAIARGAGEVAPLMLVGAVKLAPELPVDSQFPFLHPERSFMHLGFHIFDVGFQSQNSEAAKPMVYTTTLLLITIIAVLNLAAIWLRNRLRRKFSGDQF
ncbi:MAG: phosphate ABC transporter permease PstA [Acidobacteriota bacterium]